MLVYHPNVPTRFRDDLIQIEVVWEDETHILGNCVNPTAIPPRRVLIEKSQLPKPEDLEKIEAERIRREIKGFISDDIKHPISLEVLRQIKGTIVAHIKEGKK